MSDRFIIGWAIAAVIGIMLLSGCAPAPRDPLVRVVEKSVPVAEIRPVPPELIRTRLSSGMLPEFVPAGHPAATSCLTPEGEARLRVLLIDRESRLEAWEKWGVLE